MGTIRKVGMFEAKTHFSALVEEVRNGGEIEITKRGESVAKLTTMHPQKDRRDVAKAVEELRELRKGVTLGGLKIKDLINEGRKY
jgi:prevent-host-death family protein